MLTYASAMFVGCVSMQTSSSGASRRLPLLSLLLLMVVLLRLRRRRLLLLVTTKVNDEGSLQCSTFSSPLVRKCPFSLG